ncbi:lactonase family protein [Leptospira idonii]|uniref:Lactonase n=1 Tax=Leptospira idonii TaxID=1193500 RepID=A0A4R9M5D3_9LEPT|nr:beta-propeller fold lactonase family protein [Leptospira idonii]TGN21025.1 hypothetical protein EHS15_00450 [Leptospira idonii]
MMSLKRGCVFFVLIWSSFFCKNVDLNNACDASSKSYRFAKTLNLLFPSEIKGCVSVAPSFGIEWNPFSSYQRSVVPDGDSLNYPAGNLILSPSFSENVFQYNGSVKYRTTSFRLKVYGNRIKHLIIELNRQVMLDASAGSSEIELPLTVGLNQIRIFADGIGDYHFQIKREPQYLYVLKATSPHIFVYEIASDGKISSVSGSPFSLPSVSSAFGFDFNIAHSHIVTANNADQKGSVIRADFSGTPVWRSNFNVVGANNLNAAFHPSGKYFLAGSTTLSSFSFDAESEKTELIHSTAGSSTAARGGKFTPDGKYYFLTEASSGLIKRFSFSKQDGMLGAAVGVGNSINNLSTSLSITPDGKYLYSSEDSRLAAYSINSDGNLSSIGNYNVSCSTYYYYLGSIDPSSKFIYVPCQSGNSIVGYSIASNGALTSVASLGVSGAPTNTAIDLDGKYLYVGTSSSNSISVYSINASTGALALIETEPCNGVSVEMKADY